MNLLFQLRDLTTSYTVNGHVLSSTSPSIELGAAEVLTDLADDPVVTAGALVSPASASIKEGLDKGKISITFGSVTYTSYASFRGALPLILTSVSTGVAVADAASLALFSDLGLAEGTIATTSTGSKYTLYRVTGLTPASNQIIAALSGVGYWLREGSNPDQYQSIWYIAASTGSDTNSGLTSLTAVKTLAEVERRTQGILRVNTRIVYTEDSTEAIAVNFQRQNSTNTAPVLFIEGTRIVSRSSTLTSAATLATSSARPTVTDTTVSAWEVGKFLSFANGVTCVILEDLGAGVAAVTPFCSWNQAYDATSAWATASAPLSGAAYSVYDLIQVEALFSFEARGLGTDAFFVRKSMKHLASRAERGHGGFIYDCALRNSDVAFGVWGIALNSNVAFYACHLSLIAQSSTITNGSGFGTGFIRARWCGIGNLGYCNCRINDSVFQKSFAAAAILYATGGTNASQAVLGDCGFFGGWTSAISLRLASEWQITGPLYGTAVGAAFDVSRGARLEWISGARSTRLGVTGGSTDITIDGTNYTYAAFDALGFVLSAKGSFVGT